MAIVKELPQEELNAPYTRQIEWLEDIAKSIRDYIEKDRYLGSSTHTNTTIAYAILYYVESLSFGCKRCEKEKIKFPFSSYLDFQKAVAADIYIKFIHHIKVPVSSAISSGGKLLRTTTRVVLGNIYAAGYADRKKEVRPILFHTINNGFEPVFETTVDLDVEQISLDGALEIWKNYADLGRHGIDNLQRIITQLQSISDRHPEITKFFHFVLCLCWIENYILEDPSESANVFLACQSYIQKRIAELSVKYRHNELSLQDEIDKFKLEQSYWLAKGKEKNTYALDRFFNFAERDGGYMNCVQLINVVIASSKNKHASIIQLGVFLHYVTVMYREKIATHVEKLKLYNNYSMDDEFFYKHNLELAQQIRDTIRKCLKTGIVDVSTDNSVIEQKFLLEFFKEIHNQISLFAKNFAPLFQVDPLLLNFIKACFVGIFPNFSAEVIPKEDKYFTEYPSYRICSVGSDLMYESDSVSSAKHSSALIKDGNSHDDPLFLAKKLAFTSLNMQDYVGCDYGKLRKEGSALFSLQASKPTTLFTESQSQKFLSYILVAEFKYHFTCWILWQIERLKKEVGACTLTSDSTSHQIDEMHITSILRHIEELGAKDKLKLIQQLSFIYQSHINLLVFEYESGKEKSQLSNGAFIGQVLLRELGDILRIKFGSIISVQVLDYFIQHKIQQLQDFAAKASSDGGAVASGKELIDFLKTSDSTKMQAFPWLNTMQQMLTLRLLKDCGLSFEQALPRIAGLASAELVFLRELIEQIKGRDIDIRYYFPENDQWFYNQSARTTLLRMLQVDKKLNIDEAIDLLNKLKGDELVEWSKFVANEKFLQLTGMLNIKKLIYEYEEHKYKKGFVFWSPDTFNVIWHLSHDVRLDEKNIIACLYKYLNDSIELNHYNYTLVCEIAAKFEQEAKGIIMQSDDNYPGFNIIEHGERLLQIADNKKLGLSDAMQALKAELNRGCVVS